MMKKSIGFIFVCICFFAIKSMAQSGVGIYLQAVARDIYANPAKDRKIYVKTSVIQSTPNGTAVLIEEFQTQTDAIGIFGVSIGLGTRVGGTKSDLSSIDWANGPYYLNIKVSISPLNVASDWDYTKEWNDLGTSPFGTVPYALYAGTATGLDAKLNAYDTSKMLIPYAKDAVVKNLSSVLSATLDSNTILRLNANKLNIKDSITAYVTPSQLAAKTFDSSTIYNQLSLKELSSNKSTSISTDASSDIKFPSVKAVKTYVDGQIAVSTIADADATTKGKLALAGDLSGTAAQPTISNNAITTNKIADASVTDAKIVSVTGAKINGNINGNAATATKLATSKNINGVAFDGSSDITITAASNTLTGTTLATNITSSSLTGVGTLTSGSIPYGLLRGTPPIWNQNTSGNAATATKLAATKNINGVAFDGSSDITITAASNTLTGTTLATNITSSSLTGVGTLTSGSVPYSLLSGTIPTWNQNTTGNASTATKLSSSRVINITGDISYTSNSFDGSADVTGVGTLSNTGVTSGTYGSSTAIPSLTIDAKGRITNATTTSIVAGVNTVNSISATSNAKGATISGTSITLTPADANNGGVVTTGTQTFAGAKTFSNTATFNTNINVNGISVGRGNGNNDESVAIGSGAMGSSNINGKRNTAVGAGAMQQYNGTAWDNNTSIGYNNMPSMTSGSANTSVGAESMLHLLTGTENTSIGNQSLINVTGNSNVGVGKRSGQTITAGSQNTIIGTDADVSTNNFTNATAIGYGAIVNASNTIQLGNTSVTKINTNAKLTSGAVTYPNSDGSSGQFLTTNGSGTLSWASPAGGVTSIGNIDASSNSQGASITSGVLTLAPADANNGGIITTSAQTIAGDKTFKGSLSGAAAIGNSEITSNLTISSTNSSQYNGTVLICNPSSAINIIIDNSTTLPTGFNFMVVQKSSSSNRINFVAGTSASIVNRGGNTATAGQYAIATLVHIGNGVFVTSGDMQ